MGAADELIDRIVNSSPVPYGKRQEIQRELRAHIEDFVGAARAAGRDYDEVEKLLQVHFGDPDQIARGFAWVYRYETRRIRVFAYALSTVLLASSLLAGILALQAGLAFTFGTPIMNVLASWHTMIEALDILASVAAYLAIASMESLFQYHRFGKAALLLTLIITVIKASCRAAGLHTAFLSFGLVNAVFFRAVQRFVGPKAARIGIVAVCFPLAGLVSALSRSPVSQAAVPTTCASWLVMGVGYQLMTDFAAHLDRAFVKNLERNQAAW